MTEVLIVGVTRMHAVAALGMSYLLDALWQESVTSSPGRQEPSCHSKGCQVPALAHAERCRVHKKGDWRF